MRSTSWSGVRAAGSHPERARRRPCWRHKRLRSTTSPGRRTQAFGNQPAERQVEVVAGRPHRRRDDDRVDAKGQRLLDGKCIGPLGADAVAGEVETLDPSCVDEMSHVPTVAHAVSTRAAGVSRGDASSGRVARATVLGLAAIWLAVGPVAATTSPAPPSLATHHHLRQPADELRPGDTITVGASGLFRTRQPQPCLPRGTTPPSAPAPTTAPDRSPAAW